MTGSNFDNTSQYTHEKQKFQHQTAAGMEMTTDASTAMETAVRCRQFESVEENSVMATPYRVPILKLNTTPGAMAHTVGRGECKKLSMEF